MKSKKECCGGNKKKRIMIVRVGSDERPAGPADIENALSNMKRVLDNAGIDDVELFVTHHCIEVDTYSLAEPKPNTIVKDSSCGLSGNQSRYKSLFLVQAPEVADEKEIRSISSDLKKLVDDAGMDAVVYVSKHNLCATQFQFEKK